MRRARLEAAEEMLVVDSSKPEVTYVTFSFAVALQADWLIRNTQITWNNARMTRWECTDVIVVHSSYLMHA